MKIIVFFVCIFFHVKGAIGFQLQGKDFASRLAEIKGYEGAGVGTVERGVIFSFFQFVFQKTAEFSRAALLKQISKTEFDVLAVVHNGADFGRHRMAVNQQAETKLLDTFVNQLLQALVISVVYVSETFLNFVEIQQTVIYVVIVGGNSVYHA